MIVQSNSDFNGLEKNRFYTVYAMDVEDEAIYFYVSIDNNFTLPDQCYASMFSVIDNRASRYWSLWNQNLTYEKIIEITKKSCVSFPEWEKDKYFYYKLVEGEAVPDTFTEEEALSAIETFKHYKSLMDLEFAMPGVTTFAEYSGKGNWLLCPKCIDAWEEPHINVHEMVKCPKCENTFLNPVKIDANKMQP